MSTDQVKQFLAAVAADESLQKRLATQEENPVDVAKEIGFSITMTDLLKYSAETTLELSDEDLESAAGGVTPLTVTLGYLIGGATVAVITVKNCGQP